MLTDPKIREHATESIRQGILTPEEVAERLERQAERYRQNGYLFVPDDDDGDSDSDE